MNATEILRELSLDKYCGFLTADPARCGLFLCDDSGRFLARDGCGEALPPTEVLSRFRQAHPQWVQASCCGEVEDPDEPAGWAIWHQPLVEAHNGVVGYAVHCRRQGVGDQERQELEQRMQYLADSLVDDYRMVAELNEMAAELGERYDELNLLYSVEDHFNGQNARLSRVLLMQLVEDSARHLGVDAVELWLDESDASVRSHRDDQAEPRELLSRLRPALFAAIRRNHHPLVVNRDDDGFWTSLGSDPARAKFIAAPIFDVRHQVVGVFAVLNDRRHPDFLTTHRKVVEVIAEQASNAFQAVQDPLTGLLNRRGLEDRIDDIIAQSGKSSTPSALLYLDIVGFKLVNDTCGYSAGDELLRQVASVISDAIKGNDLVGRLGSDEFGILLGNCTVNDACAIAERILDTGRNMRFQWLDKSFEMGFCIGVVDCEGNHLFAADLLRAADAACQLAKQRGRHHLHVYREDDDSLNRHRSELDWMQVIQQALEEDRFELFAQKIKPVHDSAEHHFEILLRLRDSNGDLVPPITFIPVAEKFQMMSKLDQWVVHQTIEALNRCHRFSPQTVLRVSINLSGQSFNDSFLASVDQELNRCQVPLDRIGFEITETSVISDMNRAFHFISHLRGRGCPFFLDDFGTGLSSLSYLKRLPVDYLKIDGAFIRQIAEDPVDAAMVGAIVSVARILELQTVAEYVENGAVQEMLEVIGIDHCQGYHIHRPGSLDEEVRALVEALPRSMAANQR